MRRRNAEGKTEREGLGMCRRNAQGNAEGTDRRVGVVAFDPEVAFRLLFECFICPHVAMAIVARAASSQPSAGDQMKRRQEVLQHWQEELISSVDAPEDGPELLERAYRVYSATSVTRRASQSVWEDFVALLRCMEI